MNNLSDILRANTQGARTVALVGNVSKGLLRELVASFGGRVHTTASPETVSAAGLPRTVYTGDLASALRGADVAFVQYGVMVDAELLAKVLGTVSPGVWVVAAGNLPAAAAVGTVMKVTSEEKTLSVPPWYFYRSRRNAAPIECACSKRR